MVYNIILLSLLIIIDITCTFTVIILLMYLYEARLVSGKRRVWRYQSGNQNP
jgi:hypothetical protein